MLKWQILKVLKTATRDYLLRQGGISTPSQYAIPSTTKIQVTDSRSTLCFWHDEDGYVEWGGVRFVFRCVGLENERTVQGDACGRISDSK
jgi:hypothetical protein